MRRGLRHAARGVWAGARRLPRSGRRLAAVVGFAGYFCGQLVVATAAVTWTVLVPRGNLRPAIVEVRVAGRTDHHLALLTGLLGLVPGTMPLAVRRDPPTLWVHGLRVDDRETFRRQVRAFEDRVLRAFGDGGGLR